MKTKTRRRKKSTRSKTAKWKSTCSIFVEDKGNLPSCVNASLLKKLVRLWNARYPDNRVKGGYRSKRQALNALREKFMDACSNEKCMVERIVAGTGHEELVDHLFAPQAPKEWVNNRTEWLSSLDILKLMNHYEKKYSCFEFIGPSPIDYDFHIDGECVWQELCEFNSSDYLSKGKRKIGVIFNLDPHYKGGSHWVALFVNIASRESYYFDSYGIKPPHQIQKFMDGVSSKDKQHIMSRRHQYEDSECGMYSLNFIIQMLKQGKKAFDKLEKTRLPDKKMVALRDKYFNIG
jgi:hypothetical protein